MKSRNVRFESLAARQLMAADIMEIEPNDSESTATKFNLPALESVVLKGATSSKNDKDYFSFTPANSSTVEVSLSGPSSVKLEIADASGHQVLETQAKDGVTRGSWNASAGAMYLLKLRSSADGSLPYNVTLSSHAAATGSPSSTVDGATTTAPADDTQHKSDAEPNDELNSATIAALTPISTLHLTGSADKRDRDFYSVKPDQAGTVTLSATGTGVKVSVETATGTKLFETETNDGVRGGSFTVSTTDAFVMRVRGTMSTLSNYDVTLSLSTTATNPATPAPVVTASTSSQTPEAWYDTSDDGVISPLDVLLVVNRLNSRGSHAATDDVFASFDINDDGFLSAIDALLVINRINRGHGTDDTHPDDSRNRLAAEGEGPDDRAPRAAEFEIRSEINDQLPDDHQRRRRQGR